MEILMKVRPLTVLSHLDRVPQVLRCRRRIRRWRSLTRTYVGLGATRYPVVVETTSGLQLQLHDLDDVRTIWAVFCRDEYAVPPSTRTIVDIGANYGAFTCFAATAAPEARILSCEPFPSTFERLEENVRVNGFGGRVRSWQAAVAAETGRMLMGAAPDEASPFRHLLRTVKRDVPTVKVQTLSWCDLMNRARAELGCDQIDLVKLDVEGTEYDVFIGIDPRQLAAVKELQLEYHHGPKAALFEAISGAGFRLASDVRYASDQGVAHFRRPA